MTLRPALGSPYLLFARVRLASATPSFASLWRARAQLGGQRDVELAARWETACIHQVGRSLELYDHSAHHRSIVGCAEDLMDWVFAHTQTGAGELILDPDHMRAGIAWRRAAGVISKTHTTDPKPLARSAAHARRRWASVMERYRDRGCDPTDAKGSPSPINLLIARPLGRRRH